MKFALGEMEFELKENLLEITAKDMWGDVLLALNRADVLLLINELQAYLGQFEPDGKNEVEVTKTKHENERHVSLLIKMPGRAVLAQLYKLATHEIDSAGITEHNFTTRKKKSWASECCFSPTGFCNIYEYMGYQARINEYPGLHKFVNDILFKYDAKAVDIDEIEAFLNEV